MSNRRRVGHDEAAGAIEEFLLYVVFDWTVLVLKGYKPAPCDGDRGPQTASL